MRGIKISTLGMSREMKNLDESIKKNIDNFELDGVKTGTYFPQAEILQIHNICGSDHAFELTSGETYFMTSTGISKHNRYQNVNDCLRRIDTFHGKLKIEKDAIPYAEMLLKLEGIPIWIKDKIKQHIKNWTPEQDKKIDEMVLEFKNKMQPKARKLYFENKSKKHDSFGTFKKRKWR